MTAKNNFFLDSVLQFKQMNLFVRLFEVNFKVDFTCVPLDASTSTLVHTKNETQLQVSLQVGPNTRNSECKHKKLIVVLAFLIFMYFCAYVYACVPGKISFRCLERKAVLDVSETAMTAFPLMRDQQIRNV